MFWLRIAYRTGAVFDALMVIPMLFPRLGGALFGIARFQPTADYKYAMIVAASLMLGWACLLIWADRQPVERRGVLLLTVLPVLAGLIASGVYAVVAHLVAPWSMAPALVIQLALCGLFSSAYAQSARLKVRAAPVPDCSPARPR